MNLIITGEAPDDVIKRLKMVLSTPKGTVCYDRAFGIDLSVLDLPLAIARVKYLADCVEQIGRYEPTVRVKDVIFNQRDSLEGKITIKVVLEDAEY